MRKIYSFLILLLIFLTGCGVYSFRSTVQSGLKSIAVPQFENKSLEYGIQEELTSKLTEKFITDNALKVVNESDADAVLRGKIVKYERIAYTYDKSETVEEYKVNILIDYILEKKDGKVIAEKKNMLGFGIYNAATESEDDGKERAIDKLASDIVDQTTKSW